MKGATAKRLLTREEFHRMGDAGILTQDDRVELLNGELIQMSPIGPRHAATVRRINRLFTRRLGNRALVSPQNPVALDDYSEPEPDIAIVRPRPDEYAREHPQPRDVLLLVEVMDSSQPYDRGDKLQSYAAAGLREVWLIDLAAEVVDVCRDPAASRYRTVERVRRGQRLSITALPGKQFRVNEMLG